MRLSHIAAWMRSLHEGLASRVPAWLRQGLLLAVLLAGVVVFAIVVDGHYPLRHWLFWVYARWWLFGLLFVLASLVAGWRLLRWLLPVPSALGERFAVAFALGVLLFVWGLFLLGIVGVLGRVAFFAWPAALLAFGGPTFFRDIARARRRLRRFGFRLLQPRNLFETAAAVLLVVSLVGVYLQVLTPANVSFDAQWYHLPIAQQYAAGGRIRPFVEGWYLGTLPQLSSLVYTWAFISPGDLFDHVMLAAHLEWILFLATLPSISVLTRRLLGGVRTPYAAAVLFLFPAIFIYDSSLGLMADHVLAFWGAPLALVLLRLRRWFAPREAVVAALVTSGAALTKYQASYMVAGAIVTACTLAVLRRRLVPLAVFAATGLGATSLHWLKNLIFYHNPIYPFAHRLFAASYPFRKGGERFVGTDHLAVQFALNGTPLYKLRETAKVLFTFSFVPHDWGFHGDERPIYGSLFTLLLPVLFFVRAQTQLWMAVAGVHLGIAIWFVTSHEDRYLQSLLPWITACTAALLVLTWRSGTRPVRAALVSLVAFQAVWGADSYFIRGHGMVGDSIVKSAVDHLAAGHDRRYAERFKMGNADFKEIAKILPKNAKVMTHEMWDRLGLDRESVQDHDEWQLGIDYLSYPTPAATMAVWRRMGITHVVWKTERGASSYEQVALEAVFNDAIGVFGADTRSVGGYLVTRLATGPSPARAQTPTRLAWLGCGGDPPMGVYLPNRIGARRAERLIFLPDLEGDVHRALSDVSVVVLRPSCSAIAGAAAQLASSFKRASGAGDVSLWVRKP
jgi:hypothetical protein